MFAGHPFDAGSRPRSRLNVQHDTRDSMPRLVVAGELDGETVGRLHRAVIELLRHDLPGRIDVDLSDVTFLDTGGIRTLLECLVDARQVGCELRLTDPRPLVYRVLRIVGLLEAFGLAHHAPTPPSQRRQPDVAADLAGSQLTGTNQP